MENGHEQYKKAKERWFLDRLLKKEGLSTDFPPEYGEKPDFVITIDGNRIGLEVTDFFFSDVVPGDRRKFQLLREKAIEKAGQLFHANGCRFGGMISSLGDTRIWFPSCLAGCTKTPSESMVRVVMVVGMYRLFTDRTA